jgi:hypothetical protein
MRVVLILAGVGILTAIELSTPPRNANAINQLTAHSTLALGNPDDTLTKTDRLEIPYALNDKLTRPASFVEGGPGTTTIVSQHISKATGRHRPATEVRKVVAVSHSKKAKATEFESTKTKRTINPDRSKTADAKPCHPSAFDGLLKALSLSTACET